MTFFNSVVYCAPQFLRTFQVSFRTNESVSTFLWVQLKQLRSQNDNIRQTPDDFEGNDKDVNNIDNDNDQTMTQPAFTCSKLVIETIEQVLKYAQS